MSAERYIGVLSGTSLDALDLALISINSSGGITQLDALNWPLSAELQQQCHSLCTPGDNELVRYGEADRRFAEAVAEGVNALLQKNAFVANDIRAIGSHGQTVRHHPDAAPAFSLQLGCPHTIAALTGIPVVAQFRQKDIALGGEGAPLAPALHQQMFQVNNEERVLANIGGIANISHLPPSSETTLPIVGFDSGPGNTLMDYWVQKHLHKPFDHSGVWAESGVVNGALLAKLLADPYFQRPPPKSTGREYFTPAWLERALLEVNASSSTSAKVQAVDIQATLLELTAVSLTNAIKSVSIHTIENTSQYPTTVYVCGGGAHNNALLKRCQTLCPEFSWRTTAALGVNPDWVEAVLFAWLAWAHCHQVAIDLRAVTGAKRPSILGAYIPAN
ncbi:anhydro-N-acetylmuramic acid kinase [Aliidiomarina iranensis]|uniref:Anhydro-N-acetylmuramic acid kinase n=1 Tax=Aliidiomarina iranensis TaxID=1434071 RepID=A0A432VV62_9GAMM|nr:anhydro-N-acetylmuramic acid kinase [Aliidiomarina iranensis]RUO20385.1 anhydro-N-acetylmuramic acid kinase [Aliidiomarina iranensis]